MAIPDEFKQRTVKRGYVWLKLYTGLLDEPDFMQLTDKAKAVYFEVYILAGRSDAGGLVTASDKPATVDSLAWLLRRTPGELQSAIDELTRSGLVNLQDGHVTVCRFAGEQGPSQDDIRAKWRDDQRKSRARAKGEKLADEPEPELDAEPEQEKEKDAEKEKELEQEKDKTKTKTKRVSTESERSQDGVSPDSGSSSLFNEYADSILSLWQTKTGKRTSKSGPFLDVCRYWFNERVTIPEIAKTIDTVQTYAEPNTPMYLRDAVINLKNSGPKDALVEFRKLYDQDKARRGGTYKRTPMGDKYVPDKSGEIVVIDDGSEVDGPDEYEF